MRCLSRTISSKRIGSNQSDSQRRQSQCSRIGCPGRSAVVVEMAAGADGWIQYIGASLPRRPERFGALNDKVDRRSLVRNNPQNMADSIAERVKRRRNSHVEDEDNIVQAPEVSLGEDVLFCELIRDGILKHFNPCKLSDLQYVLELRCFKGLVSDEDLKEMYFKRAWGFREWEFELATWRELSVGEMQRGSGKRSRGAFPCHPGMADVSSLDTKESIMREYGALAYVPGDVYLQRRAWCARLAHDPAGGRREHGWNDGGRLPRGRVRCGYGFVPDIHAGWDARGQCGCCQYDGRRH